MEACVRSYINGGKDTLTLSSGLEDYFPGACYFGMRLDEARSSRLWREARGRWQSISYSVSPSMPATFVTSISNASVEYPGMVVLLLLSVCPALP